MTKGLAATFRLLTKTKNEAAVGVLIPALDSAHETIQDQALAGPARSAQRRRAERKSSAGCTRLNPRWEAIIDEQHGRMSRGPARRRARHRARSFAKTAAGRSSGSTNTI